MSDYRQAIDGLIRAVPLMISRDRKKRVTGEYHELKTRTEKLEAVLKKYDEGTDIFPREFHPGLMREQLDYMKAYMRVLEARAELEGIDLEDIDLPEEDYCLVLFGDKDHDGAFRIGTSHAFVSALMKDLADVCVKYRKGDGKDMEEFCKGLGDAMYLLMLGSEFMNREKEEE